MTMALLRYKPATFKHSSIWRVSTFASTSGFISKRFERFSKALAVFPAAVFCEIIVLINVGNGSSFIGIFLRVGNVFRSILRISSALGPVICCVALKTINSECM